MRSQGTKLYVQELDPDTPVTMTAITATKPVTITFSAVPATFAEGRVVVVYDTGWHSVDDKPFMISDVTGNVITLADSDASAETADAELGTVSAVDLIEFCMGSFGTDEPAGPDIDTTTMCDDERVLEPGLPAAATWTVTGPWNLGEASNPQQRLRELKRSGENVVFVAQYRNNSGVVFSGSVKSISNSAAVDQPVNVTIGGTITRGVRVLYFDTTTGDGIPLVHTGAVS